MLMGVFPGKADLEALQRSMLGSPSDPSSLIPETPVPAIPGVRQAGWLGSGVPGPELPPAGPVPLLGEGQGSGLADGDAPAGPDAGHADQGGGAPGGPDPPPRAAVPALGEPHRDAPARLNPASSAPQPTAAIASRPCL